MAKIADRYFACDPWNIVEKGFDPAHARVSESVFSLANERMGVRGYPEEGGTAPSLRGSYLNGVYELEGEPGAGGYKGIVKQTHYMVTAADALETELRADGGAFDLDASLFTDFERCLELRNGRLTRELVWRTKGGRRVRCRFERLVGMEDSQWLMQRMTFTALDEELELHLGLHLNGNIPHRTYGNCLWRQEENRQSGDALTLTLATAATGQRVRYAMRTAGCESFAPCQSERRIGIEGQITLKRGVPYVCERAVSVCAQRDCEEEWPELPRKSPSFEEVLESNAAHYAAFWERSDVRILGDPENQQGIRFCLFQLHQAYRGENPRDNIGAKGLTGEVYNGHAFWDTETYCLPYYLLNDGKAARQLLMYRYHTLEQALQRARELDLQGACYPIATLNGREGCTLWQHASLQMQPSTAVAYGIALYARLSNDRAFLWREGMEMLVQICRYLTSRGDWNSEKTAYGYYGVMGPDEFHLMVNHNFYTNYMGQKTLRFTLKTLGEMEPDARKALSEKTGLTDAEPQNWEACANAMRFLSDGKGLFEQHEGYFGLPHVEADSISPEEFPLYEHWSYDRIYRTDLLKQPDVLMAMFLYPGDFTREQKRRNYEYYEPRCIHESSLSPSIHAILAAELERGEEACRFFGHTARLDLDDYNRNTGDGLHTTGIAAAWMTIVMGFGGLRTDGPLLSLRPMLPRQWEGYSFMTMAGPSRIRVAVWENEVALTLLEGEECEVLLFGSNVTVGRKETRHAIPAKQSA